MDKNVGAVERERETETDLLFSKINGDRGITLVALIITIIILLILAGVSLSFVFNGGILDKSQQAVDEYQKAVSEEENELDKIDKYLEEKLKEIGGGSGEGPTDPETPIEPDDGLAKEDITIVATDDPNVQIVIPEGFAPVILQTGRTDSMPGENGAVKEIMPVEQWNSITAEQINKGIVVVDHAITYTDEVPDFNEYVWIPITDSSKFVRNGWGKTLGNETDKSNKYWEETSSKEYTDMVDSVSRNKGFYISRYEASQKDSATAQSKRGNRSWIEMFPTTAITASSNMNGSINSHLIYGVEWDSVLQWLLDSQAIIGAETSGQTRTITIDDITDDSRSWGNYDDSVGGAATDAGGFMPKPGGTNEYWKVNNIYDLAGNARELTQEKYSTDSYGVYRGECCYTNGADYPAANRGSSVAENGAPNLRV